VWPDQAAAAWASACRLAAQHRGEFCFGGKRRHGFEPILYHADEPQPSARKRAVGLGTNAVKLLDGRRAGPPPLRHPARP